MLRFIVPILSAVFISMAACPVEADTFHFSFANTANIPGGGVVTGTVILNATDTAATSVTVDTNSGTGNFGIGQYIGSPTFNSFTVVSGQITVADFLDFGSHNSSPAVTCCTLALALNAPNSQAGLSNASTGAGLSLEAPTFTPVVTPLPGALPLFATGLVGLGLLGWRRKKKTAA
jgi:hypothetical protein